MNVKQIVTQYLEANRFGGLRGKDCGCILGPSLFHCLGDVDCQIPDCEPGYKIADVTDNRWP